MKTNIKDQLKLYLLEMKQFFELGIPMPIDEEVETLFNLMNRLIEQEPTEEVKPINNKIERLKRTHITRLGENGFSLTNVGDKINELVDYINSNNK